MSCRDGNWKKARRLGQNDMRHRNLFHSRRKLAREHVDRDDRGRFRVRENMRHFMRRIERIDIDEHAARLENAECGDRIGEPVWNLDRDPGSRLQVQRFAQIGGEGVRIAIDFAKLRLAAMPFGMTVVNARAAGFRAAKSGAISPSKP